MANKPQGDWGEYRSLILAELKRINDGVEDVRRKVDEMRHVDVGTLKTQMAVMEREAKIKSRQSGALWGAITGGLPTLGNILWQVFHK